MKLAFSTNAFKKYSLQDSIKKISTIGYEGVEILADIPHAYPPMFGKEQIGSVIDTLSECKIQVSNLNAFTLYAITDVYHPSWIENDTSLRELRIQHTINCIKLAQKIGSKNISTEPGGPIEPGTDIAELKKRFIRGLNKTAAIAEENKIKILIEPEPDLLLENSAQFLHFINDINSDYVRLKFDIGHFYCVSEDPAKLVYRLADYVEHFHLADIADRVHNHLIPGKGSIDFRSVFQAINGIGYKGFVTVELYPYQDNPVYAAAAAYRYLSEILNQIS
ncbi:MAG: sugar phosphate isomerase/epimerase [Candidatus Nitrosopolaris sp.]